MAVPAPEPQFAQEAISEYHLYTLERRTNLQQNETKQISLLASTGVHIDKLFEVDGQLFYYRSALRPGEPIKDPVQVHLKFKNSQDNSLGQPLPAGTVRVYQGDSKGRVQFIGEDHIDHTPKDETLDLHIGNAPVVHIHSARLDEPAGVALRRGELHTRHQIDNPDPLHEFTRCNVG